MRALLRMDARSAASRCRPILNRMDARPARDDDTSTGIGASRTGRPRYPAQRGVHPERDWLAEELRLMGRIDLLSSRR